MVKKTKQSKAQIIANWIKDFPRDTDRFIAGKVGCDISYVWAVRKKMKAGYVYNVPGGAAPQAYFEAGEPVAAVHEEVNHPAHYTDGGIETIDFIEAKLSPEEFRGYCLGNIIKYLSRTGKKGDLMTDLRKAQWFLDRVVTKG